MVDYTPLMRTQAALLVAICLAGCSEPPAETKAKAPEKKPPAPVSGRHAVQQTYPQARTWANDCAPVRARSYNLKEVASADGKAGAWDVTYASPSRNRAKTFTWSAVDAEGGLRQGVFSGSEESWSPTSARPFAMQAVQIDTPEALKTAEDKSSAYLKRPGERPPVSFLLEYSSRFPNPVWRIYWGESVSAAEYTVFIDASSGAFLQKN